VAGTEHVDALSTHHGRKEVAVAADRLTVEIEPDLGRRVEIAAQRRDTSIRQWIEDAVHRELEREEIDGDALSRISVPPFERDWTSDEDAVYDELAP
jgi:predicted transcriptional regulator